MWFGRVAIFAFCSPCRNSVPDLAAVCQWRFFVRVESITCKRVRGYSVVDETEFEQHGIIRHVFAIHAAFTLR